MVATKAEKLKRKTVRLMVRVCFPGESVSRCREEVLVDAADAHLVAGADWLLAVRRSKASVRYYAIAGSGQEKRLMHRIIAGAAEGMDVDHRNGDGLDNRRSNLRECTRHQNLRNRDLNGNSTTGFKGVCFDRSRGKYLAHITIAGKQQFLGRFVDARDAAKAYDAAAAKLFGEYARTNSTIGGVR